MIDPKTINERNRRFYRLDVKPFPWTDFWFWTLWWSALVFGTVAFALKAIIIIMC